MFSFQIFVGSRRQSSWASCEFNTHRRRRRDADATQLVTGAENWKLGHDWRLVRSHRRHDAVTQLDFVVGKLFRLVETRRNCRQLVANSIHTADATQLDSWVASASAVCIGLKSIKSQCSARSAATAIYNIATLESYASDACTFSSWTWLLFVTSCDCVITRTSYKDSY